MSESKDNVRHLVKNIDTTCYVCSNRVTTSYGTTPNEVFCHEHLWAGCLYQRVAQLEDRLQKLEVKYEVDG